MKKLIFITLLILAAKILYSQEKKIIEIQPTTGKAYFEYVNYNLHINYLDSLNAKIIGDENVIINQISFRNYNIMFSGPYIYSTISLVDTLGLIIDQIKIQYYRLPIAALLNNSKYSGDFITKEELINAKLKATFHRCLNVERYFTVLSFEIVYYENNSLKRIKVMGDKINETVNFELLKIKKGSPIIFDNIQIFPNETYRHIDPLILYIQ